MINKTLRTKILATCRKFNVSQRAPLSFALILHNIMAHWNPKEEEDWYEEINSMIEDDLITVDGDIEDVNYRIFLTENGVKKVYS